MSDETIPWWRIAEPTRFHRCRVWEVREGLERCPCGAWRLPSELFWRAKNYRRWNRHQSERWARQARRVQRIKKLVDPR